MSRNRFGSFSALAIGLVALSGCTSGPSYLTRTVDDWQNKQYAENPLLTGVISDVIPGYTLAKIIAAVPDILILNPIQFWCVDLWKAEGVAFQHKNPGRNHAPWFQDELGLSK